MFSPVFYGWRWRAGRLSACPRISLFLLLLLAPWQARAQSSAGSARLESIAISGSRFPSDQIAAAVGLHSGANITRDDLQSAADRLAKLGTFATVQYRFSSADSGVRVDYVVTDAPGVPVRFDNFPWFSDDELTAAIKGSVVLFDGSAPAGGAILDQMSSALSKLLETKGVHAEVSHAFIVLAATGEKVQQFRVEGAAPRVGAVEFSDALANSDRHIQQSLSDVVGKPFSHSAMELFEFEQVRPVYLAHAFLHVRFGAVAARLTGSAKSDLPNQVNVTIAIDPGPSYAWNGVSWSGNNAFPSTDLDAFVKLKPGEPADGNAIEALWQSLRDAYSRHGFLDATVQATPEFDDAGKRVRYAVAISEGSLYHMGNLILTGLSPEGERKIRAAWKIMPNAVFDKSVYDDFLENGIKQALTGTQLRYDKIGRFLQQDAANGKVDVLLDFQ